MFCFAPPWEGKKGWRKEREANLLPAAGTVLNRTAIFKTLLLVHDRLAALQLAIDVAEEMLSSTGPMRGPMGTLRPPNQYDQPPASGST